MPLDDDVTLGDRLLDLTRALIAELFERLALAGFPDLTLESTAIFKDVASEGSSVGDLAQRAQVGEDVVRRAAATMADQGYAEVGDDVVRLTERGWAAVGAGRRALREIEESWAQRIGDERFAIFAAALRDLAAWQAGRPQS